MGQGFSATGIIVLVVVLVLGGVSACGGAGGQQEEVKTPGPQSTSMTKETGDVAGTAFDFGGVEEKIWFIEPTDGAEVVSPFKVKMGSQGVMLRRMGTAQTAQKGYGHHHIIIDAPLPPLDQKIPTDEQHLHFHNYEEEAVLSLPVGEHTLRLLFGDWIDTPYKPLLTDTITVTVTAHRRVFFVEPEDDAQIRETPFKIVMGAEGLADVAGHFAVVMKRYALPPEGEPVPSDETHIHFAEGETEGMIDLPPKGYKLHLIFVDPDNMPFDPPIMDSIDVAVWGGEPQEQWRFEGEKYEPK